MVNRMLTTMIHTPPAKKAMNPAGVKAAIPSTIATQPSHLGKPPWRTTERPAASTRRATPATAGTKSLLSSTLSVCTVAWVTTLSPALESAM